MSERPRKALRYSQDGHVVARDWFVIVLPDDPGATRSETALRWRQARAVAMWSSPSAPTRQATPYPRAFQDNWTCGRKMNSVYSERLSPEKAEIPPILSPMP